MLEPGDNARKLQPRHGIAATAAVIVTVIVAFWALSFIVGTIAFLVKLAVVLGIAYVVIHLLVRKSRS